MRLQVTLHVADLAGSGSPEPVCGVQYRRYPFIKVAADESSVTLKKTYDAKSEAKTIKASVIFAALGGSTGFCLGCLCSKVFALRERWCHIGDKHVKNCVEHNFSEDQWLEVQKVLPFR